MPDAQAGDISIGGEMAGVDVPDTCLSSSGRELDLGGSQLGVLTLR
jgi:hypothetical protein